MFQLLQSEKQRLTIMWAQFAPLEPTAELTPAAQGELKSQWVEIAPSELHDYKADCLERKAAFELSYNIPDFFAPAPDEKIAFEDSLQAHRNSYIIWE